LPLNSLTLIKRIADSLYIPPSPSSSDSALAGFFLFFSVLAFFLSFTSSSLSSSSFSLASDSDLAGLDFLPLAGLLFSVFAFPLDSVFAFLVGFF